MDEREDVVEAEVVEATAVEAMESTTAALDSVTRAEIDMQIATARRYPRQLAKARDNMVAMATLDEETAEACFYSLKRRDATGQMKVIQGESIRMAEIALACYGNVRAGTRLLGETEDGKFVRVLGVCHDLENNVVVAREVARRITTRKGVRFGDDMVGVTIAAASAIAMRNAVLAVVPRAMIRPAYLRAKEVATGKAKSLSEQRLRVIERLRKLSPLITAEKILAAVDRRSVDELTPDDVTHLIGLGTAIRDGMQTVEEAFPDAANGGSVSVAEIVGEKPDEKKGEPSESGPPWETIPEAKAKELSARLRKVKLEDADLTAAVLGDESLPLKDLPLSALEQAEKMVADREAAAKK